MHVKNMDLKTRPSFWIVFKILHFLETVYYEISSKCQRKQQNLSVTFFQCSKRSKSTSSKRLLITTQVLINSCMEDAPVNKSSLIDYDDKMSKLFVSKLIKNGSRAG